MGHLVGKEIYRQLGSKIDQLSVRTPWNETLYQILKELYTPQEAELLVRMPFNLSSLQRISRVTGMREKEIEPLLESLCSKGLVMDVWHRDHYRYFIAPMAIGIFEFSMMRPSGDYKRWAELFHNYLSGDSGFYDANFAQGEQISFMRAMPHEAAFEPHLEVMDYERASAVIEANDTFALGLCSCRHEKLHADEKPCDIPLETCSSFGTAAEYMIRNKLSRPASKEEMLDLVEFSRDQGLVINADNVTKDVSYFCHCCGCCCNALRGISQFGYAHTVVTSNYIAAVGEECNGCGACSKACPINAIQIQGKRAVINQELCLGCGVCVLKCKPKALRLAEREQRVMHPANTFERILLQCLERGTLQNFIFDNPQALDHKFMRALVGGFLRLPPVKRGLMNQEIRSRFLARYLD